VKRIAILVALLTAPAARADPVADFYKGTTVDVIVGSAVGGGYDAYARFLARHIGRHIPGRPNVIVKNMPGAGGMIAGNYVFNQAPRDGSVISHLQTTLTIDQLAAVPNLKLDMRAFAWIGSINVQATVCVLAPHVPFTSVKDLLSREYIIGSSQRGTSTSAVPEMLNALVGTKFKIVLGYTGTTQIMLGMERKEVDGMCGWGWDSVQVQAMQGVETGKIRLALDIGNTPHPDLKQRGVPFVMDMIAEGIDKQALQILLSQQEYGRPFAGPPGVPPARLVALRKAFADTLSDSEFLAEAAKAKLEIMYMRPEAIEKSVAAAFTASDGAKRRAIEVVQSSTGK
jgi:tripartite-type tricarboxylate transporter receptor subunit TctC